MSARDLVIVGAIGICLDILDAVRARGGEDAYAPDLNPIGFLDDGHAAGEIVDGLPVLGGLADAVKFPKALFVNGIGSPRSFRNKPQLIERLGVGRDRFATVVHPRASISPNAIVGAGTAILANCTVNTGVTIGEQVLMLPNCVIGHGSRVGDFGTLAAGVVVSGSVNIGETTYMGAAACVRDSISIGARTLIGMGAVVINDAPDGAVLVGNPARPLSGRVA